MLTLSYNFLPSIAGWSSWKLVGLITQRSAVRVRPPLFFQCLQKASHLGGLAQPVEQWNHNPQVVGSSPTAANLSQKVYGLLKEVT